MQVCESRRGGGSINIQGWLLKEKECDKISWYIELVESSRRHFCAPTH